MTTTNRCSTHPSYEADYCPRCGTAAIIPTPGEVADAAASLSDAEIDFLTDGAGLSGASMEALRSIIRAAKVDAFSAHYAATEGGMAERDGLVSR